MNRFFLQWLLTAVFCAAMASTAQIFVHRPFLQMGTPTQVTVCWRLKAAAPLTVRFGTDSADLDRSKTGPNSVDACVELDSLKPGARYYYRIHDAAKAVVPGQQPLSRQFAKASPAAGAKGRYTFWLAGDFGIGSGHAQYSTFGLAAQRVRDAFIRVHGSPHADGFLMLGDLAYESGTMTQLTQGTFELQYPIMASTVTWPAMGNHENVTASGQAYRDAFRLPTAGQAGGVASGSELYYSWDYGNIHFIVLEFENNNRSTSSAQYQWLAQDLQSPSATQADWLVAYFHHGPYTCCDHNSETESQLVQLRSNFIPLLEAHGVDMVFVGHSHNYERSYLLDSAYGAGSSITNQSTHYNWYAANRSRIVLDSASGNPDSTGPYRKAKGPHRGTVYTVVGSSGKLQNSTQAKHPLMRLRHILQGSLILEIEDSVATARFIDSAGAVRDKFRIVKSYLTTPVLDAGRLEKSGPAPAFSRLGRRFRFAPDNRLPVRIYGLDGGLRIRESPRGLWEPGPELLPAGVYYYRFGNDFGKFSLP